MNVVVSFLSTLVSDESNGSIRRMLKLCDEFERIARVVLDKAENDTQSKKKRKAPDEGQMPEHMPESGVHHHTAQAANAGPTNPAFSPSLFPDNLGGAPNLSDPNVAATTGLSSDLPSNVQAMPGLQDFQDMLSPNNLGSLGFADQHAFAGTGTHPMTSFQQPFVPQDLWQMPMTIEWDWADMSTTFPGFDAGGDSNPQAQQNNNS